MQLSQPDQKESGHKTLLENYLTSSDLDTKDVIGFISDMLLAGIDTVMII